VDVEEGFDSVPARPETSLAGRVECPEPAGGLGHRRGVAGQVDPKALIEVFEDQEASVARTVGVPPIEARDSHPEGGQDAAVDPSLVGDPAPVAVGVMIATGRVLAEQAK